MFNQLQGEEAPPAEEAGKEGVNMKVNWISNCFLEDCTALCFGRTVVLRSC